MKITIEATAAAPIEAVWRAWTTPEDIMRWNAASADWHCPAAELDLRPGGQFSYRMEARDGSMGFDFAGTFTRVIPSEVIEYSLGDERSVTVEFAASAQAVTIRETFDAESSHSAEQQRQGWQAILNNFARHVEARAIVQTDDTLTTLFHHNRWANLRLLEQCAALTGDQLDATLIGAYGSIRDTLQHIATAERSYHARISTGQPYRRPKDAPAMTIAEMRDSLSITGADLIEWAAKVKPGDTVQVDWDGAPRNVPKTILLTQAINHATEHRAQVMGILTHLGIEPPELDGWAYFDQRGACLP